MAYDQIYLLGLLVAALAMFAWGRWRYDMVALNIVPPRDIYDAIDWPVIVLLGAMIPVGQALTSSGTTGLIAEALVAVTMGLLLSIVVAAVAVPMLLWVWPL
jgi:di/tricarboxylate transporter